MKKSLCILMTVFLTLVCMSCGENTSFVEGNLLYDLGAESFDDIEKVEFLFEEYQGDYEEKPVITQKEDIELLGKYIYSSDWPGDKLHELLIYPNNSIFLTVNGVQYKLCFGDDGSLTTVPGNNITKALTYKAQEGKGITDSVWKEFIEKYSTK